MAIVKTPKTLLGEPEEYAAVPETQDSVTVHVLGFDQITRENFRVKLQAQAELTGGRDPEGLPLGFFLNGILLGKTAFDEFGVADIALTIDWAALQKGKALTVKVKGMAQAAPVQWDVPKSPMQLEVEERERQEKIRLEEQKRQDEERKRQAKIEAERLKPIIDQIIGQMVNISAGTFWMGATDADQQLCKVPNELPRHQVKLSAFAISKYPVTQAQWQAVMGNNPSNFKGDDRPVEQVSWNDCQAFCQKLSSITGKTFRLPTEAEWECACRAGTQTIWHFGNDQGVLGQYAWFSGNSGYQTHPVGQLKPNAWDLYDMLGNVWEWCQDWFDERYYASSPQDNPQGLSGGQYRVLRGGGYDNFPLYCRPAYRNRNLPVDQRYYFGLRVVVER